MSYVTRTRGQTESWLICPGCGATLNLIVGTRVKGPGSNILSTFYSSPPQNAIGMLKCSRCSSDIVLRRHDDGPVDRVFRPSP